MSSLPRTKSKTKLPFERFNVTLTDSKCPRCGSLIYGNHRKGIGGSGRWGGCTYVAGRPGREEMDVHCSKCGYDFRASFVTEPWEDDGKVVDTEFIRTTKNGAWAFLPPEVWNDPEQGVVAAIQYITPAFWMYSFLYNDGHFGHGYTCPYDDKHPIPPAIREIAEEELLAFAQKRKLLKAKGGRR